MYRFIESICCKNGRPQLLKLHQQRLKRTFQTYFSDSMPHDLRHIFEHVPSDTKYKCRVEYDASNIDIDFIPYINPRVNSLQVIVDDEINYDFKSADRSGLTDLFNRRKEADDIMIIKNGRITDSYFANLAFYDGIDWWTPKFPLLNGVKRQNLLDTGSIKEKDVFVDELGDFQTISLINAMNDLGDLTVSTSDVMV